MIKADELYKACQEMSNKGFVTNDLNEVICSIELTSERKRELRNLMSIRRTNYIIDHTEELLLNFHAEDDSQRVKFPDTKTDFTKKTERNKNRRKHVNPEWLNDIIRERYMLIKNVEELEFKLILDDEDAIYCCD